MLKKNWNEMWGFLPKQGVRLNTKNIPLIFEIPKQSLYFQNQLQSIYGFKFALTWSIKRHE